MLIVLLVKATLSITTVIRRFYEWSLSYYLCFVSDFATRGERYVFHFRVLFVIMCTVNDGYCLCDGRVCLEITHLRFILFLSFFFL